MDPLTLIGLIIGGIAGFVGFLAGLISIFAYIEQKLKDKKTLKSKTTEPLTENLPISDITLELPRVSYFFGRAEELQLIDSALAQGAAGWGILIDGPGGVGKTTLALYAAARASSDHFPIKIFLSAQERKLTSQGIQKLSDFVILNYITLITELGQQLGDNGIESIDPNKRVKRVYETLKNKKVLLIIDGLENFEEEEEERLFEFLHRLPSSCKAIVTSRRRNGNFADMIRLDRLNHEAAYLLIDRLAQTHPVLKRSAIAERKKLYEVSGGNPLLIEWIAAQLDRSASRCRTVDDACRFLESASSGEEALEYVFGDQLATLTNDEIRVLATLTYFSQPAKTDWLTKLTGLSDKTIKLIVENLLDRTLLSNTSQFEANLTLPLANKFLRKICPDRIDDAGKSLTTFVIKLIEENGYKQYERFPILNEYWPLIKASLPVFVNGENKTLQAVCQGLFEFPDFYGYWDDYLNLVSRAEDVAVASNDLISAGWRVYDCSFIYSARHQNDLLENCVYRAKKYWAEASEREKSYIHRITAWVFHDKEDYANAISEHAEFIRIWRNIDPLSYDLLKGLMAQAQDEKFSGALASAEENYNQALIIAIELKDYRYIGMMKSSLASIALERENWVDAENFAREALEIFTKIYKKYSIGIAYGRLAKALFKQNRKEEAIRYAQDSVNILKELKTKPTLEAEEVLDACINSITNQQPAGS